MKLYVFEKGDDQYIEREASRADRLRADGWTECGTCGGYGYALPDEEPDRVGVRRRLAGVGVET